MTDETLVSHAQNGEDVVLWRALGHVTDGRYVDVGGWDPDVDSVTRLFYERGWRGVDVEPVPEFADKFRERRPGNEIVQAVVSDSDQKVVHLHRFGDTGLSTIVEALAERHEGSGFDHEKVEVGVRRLDDVIAESALLAGRALHFVKVDVEGAEDQVLRSIDLERWRPWVLVIEATEPNSTTPTHEQWEALVLAAGYTFTLFDGLSRYYVSPDHPELTASLSHPASPLDGFETARQRDDRERIDALERRVRGLEDELAVARRDQYRWRNEAVAYWANAMTTAQASEDAATAARSEATRAKKQLARARGNLQRLRADRKRLKAQVERMGARLERAQVRTAAMTKRLEQHETANAKTVTGRLRATVRKVRG